MPLERLALGIHHRHADDRNLLRISEGPRHSHMRTTRRTRVADAALSRPQLASFASGLTGTLPGAMSNVSGLGAYA